jgi:translation initiation factor 2-alpha kinase 4
MLFGNELSEMENIQTSIESLLPESLYTFVSDCLKDSPQERPNAADLLERELQVFKMGISSSNMIKDPFVNSPSVDALNFSTPTSRYEADFEELEFLGKGGFGQVVKARNRIDGRLYAIKKVILGKNIREKVIREVLTLSRLHHQNIVRYYTAWLEQPNEGTEELDSDYSTDMESQDHFSNLQEFISSHNLSIHFVPDEEVENYSSEATSLSLHEFQRTILYIQMEFCEKNTLR